MNKVQFLNRDTYGTTGDVDRLTLDSTAYQVLYDAAADVRQAYASDQELVCRPFTISAAQSEYLGTETDEHGRESINFIALNANVTGYDTRREAPYSFVGHLKCTLYAPPGAADVPWALEAPYVSRLGLRRTLETFHAHQRPCFAFPMHSTSLRPILDYLQPRHPDASGTSTNLSNHSLQSPNIPQVDYRVPPIEADTHETGQAIHNSAITHALWQPSPTYKWHYISGSNQHPYIGPTWEFMGTSLTGGQRWREYCPTNSSIPNLGSVEHGEEPVPFNGEIANVPEDTADTDSDEDYVLRSSRPPTPISSASITVQIPDKHDRYSRPVPRFLVPLRDGTVLACQEQAAELARTIRQSQRARRGYPRQYAIPRVPYTVPEDPDWSETDSSNGPSSSDWDSDYEGSDNEEDDEPPSRPLESGDSYFPSRPLSPRRYHLGNYTMTERHGWPLIRKRSSSPPELVAGSDEDQYDHASTESVCSSMDGNDAINQAGLQYSLTPPPELSIASHTFGHPNLALLAAEPLSPSFTASPKPRDLGISSSSSVAVPPLSTLSHFAQAALSNAETALHGFQLTFTPLKTTPLQELEGRVRSLEKMSPCPCLPTPDAFKEVSQGGTFPVLDEDDKRTRALNQLAILLADQMREPKVYRAEVEIPAINTELLTGFSKGIPIPRPNHSVPPRPFQFATLDPRPSYTPNPSPTLLDNTVTLNDYDDSLYARSPSPKTPLTVEEQQMIQDIFSLDSDEDSQEIQDAGELIAYQCAAWVAELAAQDLTPQPCRPIGCRAFSTRGSNLPQSPLPQPYYQYQQINGRDGPSSRRPVRHGDGVISFGRAQNGWHDYQNGNPPWPRKERERSEAIGYALEYPDNVVSLTLRHFRSRIFPSLHQARLHHTEQRLLLEESYQAQTGSVFDLGKLPKDVYPEGRRNFSITRTDDTYRQELGMDHGTDSFATPLAARIPYLSNVGPNSMRPLQGQYSHLEQEHNRRTPPAPVTRSATFVRPGTPVECDEHQSAKRRKTQDVPLQQQVLSAETFKSVVAHWQPHLLVLRGLRGDILATIQRLKEVIEYLGQRDLFREIFFPFEEHFAISTIQQMFDLECDNNPDGLFRRNNYHLNSLLHDAEANFIQSCVILFRRTNDLQLAYTLEELLFTQFRDDMGIMQLLRAGFLHNAEEASGNRFQPNAGTLKERFEEFAAHYSLETPMAI
ncbi:hypothetical protein MVEN_01151500 [Mycena venus]|uniref:Uncharacterized protein n=1 Tax=Mycena venus TaxID=2733690 RepID=A0A8H7CYB9_9AGAR|nr:hypothetical protein MVEN_01151500 [Mycena venus]